MTRSLRLSALCAALACAGCAIGPEDARAVPPAAPDFNRPFRPAIDCTGPATTPAMDPRCATYRALWDL